MAVSATARKDDRLEGLPGLVPEVVSPLYHQIKENITRQIVSGRWLSNHELPSETDLCAHFGVSRGTLRRALDELENRGLIVRRQGRGTFVATHHTDRFLFQFFHVEREDGLREAPLVELVSFERSHADDEPARALQLRPGDAVIQIENRLLLQGSAVIHDRLTLPSALFKGLTEKRFRDRPGTVYQFYQSDFGITVLRAKERARAGAADRQTGRVLGLAPGAPVMQVRRTALTFGDRPVEHRVSIINTAHHDYVNVLSRPTAGPHD